MRSMDFLQQIQGVEAITTSFYYSGTESLIKQNKSLHTSNGCCWLPPNHGIFDTQSVLFKTEQPILVACSDQNWGILADVWVDPENKTPGQLWLMKHRIIGQEFQQMPEVLTGLAAGVVLTFDGFGYELAVTSTDGYSSAQHGYFTFDKFSLIPGHHQLILQCVRHRNGSTYELFVDGECVSITNVKQTVQSDRQLPPYGIFSARNEDDVSRAAGLCKSMYFEEGDRYFSMFGAGWGDANIKMCEVGTYLGRLSKEAVKHAFDEAYSVYGLGAQEGPPFDVRHISTEETQEGNRRVAIEVLGYEEDLWCDARLQDGTKLILTRSEHLPPGMYELLIPPLTTPSVRISVCFVQNTGQSYTNYLEFSKQADKIVKVWRF